METNERLTQIESHLAHLERQVEQLNDVVLEQTRTIEQLRLQLRRIGQSLETMERDRIQATNPKPPHYQ